MGQVLEEFLKLGLMDGVDSDDSFNRLQEGAADLAAKLAAAPENLIPTVLVALDSEANVNEPILKQAEACVLSKWKTFRGRYQDPPRALLRAVIWEALDQTTAGSTQCSAITWLTGASVLPYARLGKERDVIRQLLQAVAQKTEETAAAKHMPTHDDAGIATEFSRPDLPIAQGTGIAEDAVQQLVDAALGPASGKTYKNGNSIQIQNNMMGWVAEVSPRLSTAISKGVNLGLDQLAEKIDNAQSVLADFTLASMTSLIKEVTRTLNKHHTQADLRLSVLWWAEALYSPSMKDSYRTLPTVAATVVMAHDLFQQVGAMTPASVTYMLGETATRLPSVTWTQKRALSSLLGELHNASKHLEKIIAKPQQHEGRRPLIETVEAVIHGTPLTAGTLAARTGLPEDIQISIPEFAMWCFRNLQARGLLEESK